MTLLLLAQPVAHGLQQLLPAAERFHLALLFLREGALAERLEPLGRHLRDDLFERLFGPGESLSEHTVEAVVVPLVLYQAGAREIVEILCRDPCDTLAQRLEQSQE